MRDTYRETPNRGGPTVGRVFFSIMSLAAAIVATAAATVQIYEQWAAGQFVLEEYFSGFSFQVSTGLIVVLIASGIYGLQSERDSLALAGARAAFVSYGVVIATMYLAMPGSGIVDPLPLGEMEWPVLVEYTILPSYLVLDWIFNSRRTALPWWTVLTAVSYPAVWLGIVIALGMRTGWYPYPALTPSEDKGMENILIFSAGAAVLLLVAIIATLLINRIHAVISPANTSR